MKYWNKFVKSINAKKAAVHRFFDGHPQAFKGILINFVLTLAMLVLLFAPMLTIADVSIDLSIPVSGWKVLFALFGDHQIAVTTVEYGNLSFLMPEYASGLFLFIAMLFLTALVMTSISLLKKGSKKLKIAAGSVIALLGFAMASIFVILIGDSGLNAIDLYGNEAAFYQVYTLGACYLIAFLLAVFAAALSFFLKETVIKRVRRNITMYVLLIIPTILMFVFNIYPMFLQTILSLKEYNISDGVFGSKWVLFANFRKIFTDPAMLQIVGNTLLISICRMVVSIIPPIILAIFLFDMGKEKFRSKIQTIIYIPHFFSWVVIYGIAYAFINPEGLINNVIVSLGGDAVKILTSESKFIPLLLFTDLWKELGWGTILYLAALTNVDPSLYEAASIDGAGPFKKLIHITLPGIAPTIVFVTVMAVGSILKGAGYEQIMLFGSENMDIAKVIDTWVIWKGLNGLQYGLGAAVSFFQSAIGLILVLLCNKLSKKLVGIGLF